MKELDSAQLFPVEGEPFGYSLHLLLGQGSDGDPAPILLGQDREEMTARVYLGAIVGEPDSLVDLVAIKMLPNDSNQAAGGGQIAVTNQMLWERWDRERLRLTALRQSGIFFPKLFQPEDGRKGLGLAQIPPLFFAREAKQLFTPPCPYCARPLETIRDETFLRTRRLPSFEESAYRLTGCLACADREGAVAVFSAMPLRLPGSVAVGKPEELARSLAKALLRDWDEKTVQTFASKACAEEALAARKSGNVPNPLAFSLRWLPFNFALSPVLVTGLSPLRWDEWADVLGGRDLAEIIPSATADHLQNQSIQRRVEWLKSRLPESGQFFFAEEGNGLDANEVLCLKLIGFHQVVTALAAFYRTTSQPHLDLNAGHVLFDPFGAGASLPSFWSFEAKLHGVASSLSAASLGFDVVLPPAHPTYPYAAPEIVEFQMAHPRAADVFFQDILPDQGSGGMRVVGRLVDPNGLFPTPSAADPIRLALPEEVAGLGLSGLTVFLKEGSEPSYQEFEFQSEPVEIDEILVKKFRRMFGARFPGVRYKVFPRFGSPSDLYSLGILLLRALSHDEAHFGAIVQALPRLSPVLSKQDSDRPAEARLRAAAAGEPAVLALLDRSSIFFGNRERAAARPNAIPQSLWEQAACLAFRLATRTSGFSVCASASDFDPANPVEKLELLLAETEGLIGSLRTLLFHRQAIHREIQTILAEFLLDEPGGREEA
ncbi:MAG: hypothetical protein L6R30_15240 [Thermoanaerobaculia bacterium]|nr:hypothetical protein [Thermoanaerobaculia bacterium]